jgi:hypothetical protein
MMGATVFKKYLFIFTLAIGLVIPSVAFTDNSFESGALTKEYEDLDNETGKKWQDFVDFQKNNGWINEQVRLGNVGVIYEKGFMGASVSRNVVPDQQKGWLVVDTVFVGNSTLLTASNLAGNVFFNSVFPYLGYQVHKSKSFINVRNVETYEEAIKAPVFSFQKIPSDLERFNKLAVGEIITTFSAGNYSARLNYGILNLLDVMNDILPFTTSVGPQAKVFVNAALKLTVTKESEKTALIIVEDVNDVGGGIGMTLGFSIENMVNAPITVGINRPTGFVPFQINRKKSKETSKTLIYKMDLSTELGLRAYQAFINKDFAQLDTIAAEKNPAVMSELKKEGDLWKTQTNIGTDLILFRAGIKNIYTDGKFVSNLPGEKRFEYHEVSNEKIGEKKTPWAGTWKAEKYSALVPTNGVNSFVIDTLFNFAVDSKDGKDIAKMLELAKQTMNGFPLNYKVNENQNYGETHVDIRFRFSSDAIAEFLAASDEDIWTALAVSSGVLDPNEWLSESGREKHRLRAIEAYMENNPNACSNGALLCNVQTPADLAGTLFTTIKKIQIEPSLVKKSRLLVKALKNDGEDKVLHRTLVELADRKHVYIKGLMRSKFL